MPILIEFALLAECTYKIGSSRVRDFLTKELENWEVVDELSGLVCGEEEGHSSLMQSQAGYLGRAYADHKKKEIAIVHRGTKLNQSSRGAKSDLINDAKLLSKTIPPYADLALHFSTHCLKTHSGYQFCEVGHSLGGALAHLCGARLGLPVIAFDPPGCKKIISSLGISNLEIQEKRHHTFLVGKNLTNSIDQHIGNVHHLGEHFTNNKKFFFDSALNTYQHKMQIILDQIKKGNCAQFNPFVDQSFSYIESLSSPETTLRCQIL